MSTLFYYDEYNTDGSILKSSMPAVNSADAYEMASAEVLFTADKLNDADAIVIAAKICVGLEPTSETRAFLERAKNRAHIAKRYYENATVNRYTAKEALCADEERAASEAQAIADAIDADEAQAIADAIDAAEAQAVADAIDSSEAQAVADAIDEDMDIVVEAFALILVESSQIVDV